MVEKVLRFHADLAMVPASFDNRIKYNFWVIVLIVNVNSDHRQVLELELVKIVLRFHIDLAMVPTSFDNRIKYNFWVIVLIVNVNSDHRQVLEVLC